MPSRTPTWKRRRASSSTASAPPSASAGKTQVLVPQQRVEVLAETDVLVCGGGPAGIAAACAAARGGARTLLIERWPFLGGMGTAALVNIWHLSDRRKLVIAGIVAEAIERAQRRITVHYAKRQQGRRMVQGQTTHLPFKLNMSGVIPPILWSQSKTGSQASGCDLPTVHRACATGSSPSVSPARTLACA